MIQKNWPPAFTPSYISFETVLREAGILFQHHEAIFVAAPYPMTKKIDDHTIIFRKLKDSLLYNGFGVKKEKGYSIATPERAFLDTIYLSPKFYFDNLRSINWEFCFELVKIYDNKQLVKRLKEYLGISMLAGKKDYLFASKLAALTDRRLLAMRDIYDVWFFAKNNWDINAEALKARTGKTIKQHIADCIPVIETVKDNEILHGLAELLPDDKTKAWVKAHLRQEAVFLLKNYQAVFK